MCTDDARLTIQKSPYQNTKWKSGIKLDCLQSLSASPKSCPKVEVVFFFLQSSNFLQNCKGTLKKLKNNQWPIK